MSTMDEAKAAMAELKRLEGEIDRVLSTLELSGAGATAPLVDAEGYPRTDVDVHAVRIDRHELAALRTDRAAAAAKVEGLLEQVHQEARESGEVKAEKLEGGGNSRPVREKFAVIGDVNPASPAAAAGLRRGDEILLFGDIDAATFDGLASLGNVTRTSVGKPVRVMIARDGSTKLLRLVPQEWGGTGLLGCRVDPI
eukprot:m.328031 g.328031  ORF g.328031 m.328031 type:complete len:197 (+) comp16499_c0_seq1:274-864(+)